MTGNMLPNLSSALSELHDNFAYKLTVVQDQCNQIRKLLEPSQIVNQNKVQESQNAVTPAILSSKNTLNKCKTRQSHKRKSSAGVPAKCLMKVSLTKEREFKYKDIGDLLSRVVPSEQFLNVNDDKFSDELVVEEEVSLQERHSLTEKPVTKLAEALKDGIPMELLNGIQEVNNYINHRKKPNVRAESEKHTFLKRIEKNWEADFEIFMMFEYDLGESLKRYLAVMAEKRPKSQIPERSNPKLLGPEEVQAAQASEEMNLAQSRVNEALLQDLSNIDFSKLLGKDKKDAVVALHHLVTALQDLTKLKCDFIIRKDLRIEGKYENIAQERGDQTIIETLQQDMKACRMSTMK